MSALADVGRSSDARVLAATHVDLQRGIKEGTFRGYSFYRLAVVRPHSRPCETARMI